MKCPNLLKLADYIWPSRHFYRLTQGGKTVYALDEEQRETSLKKVFDPRGKVEISRFKGLGEMPPAQLKETTMSRDTRRLLQVALPPRDAVGADLRRHTDQLVNTLMGKKAELRLPYSRSCQRNAHNLDVNPHFLEGL